jgi:hypothetical protein
LDLHAVLRNRKTAWRIPELARLLSLGPRTVDDGVDSGQVPAIKIGTALRISPVDAVAWVEAGTYCAKYESTGTDNSVYGSHPVIIATSHAKRFPNSTTARIWFSYQRSRQAARTHLKKLVPSSPQIEGSHVVDGYGSLYLHTPKLDRESERKECKGIRPHHVTSGHIIA